MVYDNKTKGSVTYQKLCSRDFRHFAKLIMPSTKLQFYESIILLLFLYLMILRSFSSLSDRVKAFAEVFSQNSNLDEACIKLGLLYFSGDHEKL